MNRFATLALYSVLATTISSDSKAETTYDVTFLNYPGAPATFAQSLNSFGQVTGFFVDSLGLRNGFLVYESTYTLLNYPGARETSPQGINDAGQVVGFVQNPEASFGFSYSGGSFVPFAILGANAFDATGINNTGTIVGSYSLGGEPYAYSLTGGVYSLVGAPGVLYTVPYDVNDVGQIVGATYLPERGFVLSGGTYTAIHPAGRQFSAIDGINNLGQMVGRSDGPGSAPLFFDGSTFLPFSIPNFTVQALTDINDKGQIIGWGYDNALQQRSFLATPSVVDPPVVVPEPSTAIVGFVLCTLGAAVRLHAKKG